MMDFNHELEHLTGLTGTEFVFGVAVYTAICVGILVVVQLTMGMGTWMPLFT